MFDIYAAAMLFGAVLAATAYLIVLGPPRYR